MISGYFVEVVDGDESHGLFEDHEVVAMLDHEEDWRVKRVYCLGMLLAA